MADHGIGHGFNESPTPVTPTESREVVLSLSRERLARATTRLERVTRDAVERITHLRQEKSSLEKRLVDLEKLFETERSNFEQRAALLTSVSSETEERTKEYNELCTRLTEQERLLNEQLDTIAKLEGDLSNRALQLRDQQHTESAWKKELDQWKAKVEQLESRLEKTTTERDTMRKQLYDAERESAQFVLHLTAEERDKAAKSIDTLVDQLSKMETRIVATEK
jgi:chromosome segregation ATPase